MSASSLIIYYSIVASADEAHSDDIESAKINMWLDVGPLTDNGK